MDCGTEGCTPAWDAGAVSKDELELEKEVGWETQLQLE